MDRPQVLATDLEAYSLERAMLEPQQQAELWSQITSAAMNEQELMLMRESLIYALPPYAIYTLHRDQFADIAAVYRMKYTLFLRLQHNPVIKRLSAEGTRAQNQNT